MPRSKGLVVVVILVVLLAGVAAFFVLRNGRAVAPASENYAAQVNTQTSTPTAAAELSGKVVEINVTGYSFGYNPSVIRVKKGDTVKMNYTDSDGFHDLVIDGYNLHTERITPGESSTLQFTANQAGQFAYYCSVGNHRAAGMQGTLIVE